MSVPISRFWSDLATILPEIAKSKYVAIDFEMTGIEPRRAPPLQRPTMDQLYQRAKMATETFSVLQFGMTCIIYDDDIENTFRLKSYNFNISPLFDNHSSGGAALAHVLDRTLTLSYKTLMFLSRNRIRIEDAYDGGIPYLSRAEEAEIAPELFATDKHVEHEEIVIADQKIETREFYADMINDIRNWENDPASKPYHNINNPHEGPMSRFQRRLVHQILDTEFPGKYNAVVNGNYFMQLTKRDDVSEKKVREQMYLKRQKALRSQRGLRYIIEALVGGDFAKDVSRMYELDDGMVDPEVKIILQGCEKTLKRERPILVGHNMFLDLCFLHATFFGPLPDTLDEFGRIIHELFPRIIDTKHILTRDDHEMMAPKSLDDIFLELELKDVPFTIAHQRAVPSNRVHLVMAHQAGHDSYKTSLVFLKEMWKQAENEEFPPRKLEGSHKLLQWDSDPFQQFANKVRVGNAGIWNLGGGVRPREPSLGEAMPFESRRALSS